MMGGSEASEYANAGQPDNLGLRRRAVLGGSPDRGISKPGVNSVFVVVVDVFTQQAMQVPLIQDDHVIQHLSARTPDPPFGNSILPWTPKGRSSKLDSNILDRLCDTFRKYRIVIVDEESWRVVVWECLAELLHDPWRRRIGGDTKVKDFPSSVTGHEPDAAALNPQVDELVVAGITHSRGPKAQMKAWFPFCRGEHRRSERRI